MKAPKVCFVSALYLTLGLFSLAPAETRRLTVSVTDADTGAPIAARLYLTSVAKPSVLSHPMTRLLKLGLRTSSTQRRRVRRQSSTKSRIGWTATLLSTTRLFPPSVFCRNSRWTLHTNCRAREILFPATRQVEISDQDLELNISLQRGAIRLQRAGIQAIHTCTERSMNFVTCYLLKISMSLYH